MFISSAFDAGNIQVVSQSDPQDIRLEIRADHQSAFYQWFYFRLGDARDERCRLHITNAAGAAYPGGFDNYRVLYSYDRKTWRRNPTELRDGILSWDFIPTHDSVYFAYFVPYAMERHHDLIARAQCSPRARVCRLGVTLDGQDLDMLSISADKGDNTQKKSCWFIARQHPGETMAQWWMEGLLECLLDESDPLAAELLEHCCFHVVPNMNPDGSRRGHLRTNAAGRNLNREWQTPSLEFSPEVLHVKTQMEQTGVDFFMDVHGDETLPYTFIAGTEGLASWKEADQARLDFYKRSLARRNPDFQTAQGYPPKQPGEANMGMSTSSVAQQFGCLAMTLEMPFKDTTATADLEFGWSTARSQRLARDCLVTLLDYWRSNL